MHVVNTNTPALEKCIEIKAKSLLQGAAGDVSPQPDGVALAAAKSAGSAPASVSRQHPRASKIISARESAVLMRSINAMSFTGRQHSAERIFSEMLARGELALTIFPFRHGNSSIEKVYLIVSSVMR